MRVKRTACSHNCWDTCALDVAVEGNRILRVRGVDEHELMKGFCCSKARELARAVAAPDRPRRPRVRRGGTLRETTWSEALDRVADTLAELRDTSGCESVVYHASTGSQGLLKSVDQRFFDLYGGVTRPRGSMCWSAGLEAQTLDFGAVRGHDPLDHRSSRMIVLWGRNPFATNPHLVPIVNEARRMGCRVVCIDPVRTRTASWADCHISVRPGTDHLLAAAVCRVLIDRGWVDHEYVQLQTDGLSAFCVWLQSLGTARDLAGLAGVSEETASWLADGYRSRKPVATLPGYGLQRYRNGGLAVRLIDAIAALTGNIGVAGGGVSYANLFVRESFSPFTSGSVPGRTIPWPDLARELLAARDPEIQALIVARSNPAVQLPDTGSTIGALQAIPFRVVIDHRLTETAALADVFLPCTISFEEQDLYHSHWHNYVTVSDRVVEPPAGVLTDLQILAELAGRLGFGPEFSSRAEFWLDAALEPWSKLGMGLGSLLGRTIRHPAAPSVPWTEDFLTPSGRFAFTDGGECSGLPASQPADELQLLSPKHALSLHSQFYDRVERGRLSRVWIGRSRAEREQLTGGDRVTVRSPSGSMNCVVAVCDTVGDDSIIVYPGGGGDRCVNVLTSYGGTDRGECITYYDCRVSIEKTDREGECK